MLVDMSVDISLYVYQQTFDCQLIYERRSSWDDTN